MFFFFAGKKRKRDESEEEEGEAGPSTETQGMYFSSRSILFLFENFCEL